MNSWKTLSVLIEMLFTSFEAIVDWNDLQVRQWQWTEGKVQISLLFSYVAGTQKTRVILKIRHNKSEITHSQEILVLKTFFSVSYSRRFFYSFVLHCMVLSHTRRLKVSSTFMKHSKFDSEVQRRRKTLTIFPFPVRFSHGKLVTISSSREKIDRNFLSARNRQLQLNNWPNLINHH